MGQKEFVGSPTLYLALYRHQEDTIVKTGAQSEKPIPRVIKHLTRNKSQTQTSVSFSSTQAPIMGVVAGNL